MLAKDLADAPLYQIAPNSTLLKLCCHSNSQAALACRRGQNKEEEMFAVDLRPAIATAGDVTFSSQTRRRA
jgi:hypothetical protein